jgi:hypothetical protein
MKEEDEAIWGEASGKKPGHTRKIKSAMDDECSGCGVGDCALKKLIK